MKKGWEVKKLGDVCQFVGGSQPPKSMFTKIETPGYVRLIQIRDYKSDDHVVFIPRNKAKRLCAVDDIMIGRYGPPVFQILRGLEGAYNVALMKAVPDEAQLSRDFLFYFLKSPKTQQHVIALSERAAGQSGLNKETLEPYPILLPPLPEQQRIVGILDKAFEGLAVAVANAEKNLQNARALFESHLQSVFTQRGEGWEEKPLEDICVKITDGEHLRPNVTSSGVPFLSAKDVLAHDVVFTDSLFVSEADAAKFRRRCNPEKGDILIVSRGATVGRTCVAKTDRIFCLLGSVILLKVRDSHLSQFISYWLKSPIIKNQLMTASESAAQQAIYLRDIKRLKVGCPPIGVQQSFVEQLDTLSEKTQRLATIYERKLAALLELKKSLLHQAFCGEL